MDAKPFASLTKLFLKFPLGNLSVYSVKNILKNKSKHEKHLVGAGFSFGS